MYGHLKSNKRKVQSQVTEVGLEEGEASEMSASDAETEQRISANPYVSQITPILIDNKLRVMVNGTIWIVRMSHQVNRRLEAVLKVGIVILTCTLGMRNAT